MMDSDFSAILVQRRSQRKFSSDAIHLNSLNKLIWAAQGKTNEHGCRTVPSAHGLYPLRLYVAVSNVRGLDGGFYAVDTDSSDLEKLHDRDIRNDLRDAAVDDQKWISDSAVIISICADFVTPCRDFADQQPLGQRRARYGKHSVVTPPHGHFNNMIDTLLVSASKLVGHLP